MKYIENKVIKTSINWQDIIWSRCKTEVFELQKQIAEAYKCKDFYLMYSLQQKLVRSYGARALAVRQVTSNKGGKTPGIDGIVWSKDSQKAEAVGLLKNLSIYKASPVKRVDIPLYGRGLEGRPLYGRGFDGHPWPSKGRPYSPWPSKGRPYSPRPYRGRPYSPKADGSKRPLGIPTIYDRSVQALWAMALHPIAESRADSRSYGGRLDFSTKDSMIYLKLILGSYRSRRWVLEGDIEKFFDHISHNWLLANIPMDKAILKEFLKAGFVDGKYAYPTDMGVPQGGVISPLLANFALDGLQAVLEPDFRVTRYIDDFVVVGATKELLETVAKPKIAAFLKERDLYLHPVKTLVTCIDEGFNFLGFRFKEYPDPTRVKGSKKGIFLVTPDPRKLLNFQSLIREVVKQYSKAPILALINRLNPMLRGWAEYYRCVTATRVFSKIGWTCFSALWLMLKRRHRGLPLRALAKMYFKRVGGNNWVFFTKDTRSGKEITLYQIGWTKIKRHSLTTRSNPFLTELGTVSDSPPRWPGVRWPPPRRPGAAYEPLAIEGAAIEPRALLDSCLVNKQEIKLLKKQKGLCPVCGSPLINGEDLEVHHVHAKKDGGKDHTHNLKLLHKVCHRQITLNKNPKFVAAWRKAKLIR